MKRPILWTVLFMICGIYMRLGVSKLICLVSFLFVVLSAFRFVIKEKEPRYLFLLLFVAFGFFSASYHWEGGCDCLRQSKIDLVLRLEGRGGEYRTAGKGICPSYGRETAC